MLINATRPQRVWDNRPCDVFSLESQWCQQLSFPLRPLPRHPNVARHKDKARLFALSQQARPRPRRTMEDRKSFFDNVDSGDENYLSDSLYGEYFSNDYLATPSWATPNYRIHTAGSVSAAPSGRDSVPSHSHSNDRDWEADQFHWPQICTSDMQWSFDPSYERNQYPWQAYNPSGTDSDYVAFADGLPSSLQERSLPIFGESVGYNQTSPATSFSSSTTSSAMASMSLDGSSGQQHLSTSSIPHSTSIPSSFADAGWSSAYSATVSPKVLRLNPSPAPPMSMDSHNSLLRPSDCDAVGPALASDLVPSSKRLPPKGRKELPDKPRSRCRPVSRQLLYPRANAVVGPSHHDQTTGQALVHRAKLADIKPKPVSTLSNASDSVMRSLSVTPTERARKDEYLVKSKLAGMTYKEIRRKGGFTEAESTLRGRFRTLTKHKEARVRKPEWGENDVHLLREGVRKYAKGDKSTAKIAWKQVAEYITHNGGSYHFGNATCRKKWDELVELGIVNSE